MPIKYSTEEVAQYIESKGCSLESAYTGKYTDPLTIKCKCGEIFQRSYQTFKNSKSYFCNTCNNKKTWNIQSINKLVTDRGGTLKSTSYSKNAKLFFVCTSCGISFAQNWHDFKRLNKHCMCSSCSKKKAARTSTRKISIEEVKNTARQLNCEVISTHIDNITSVLDFKCSCGNTFSQQYSVFRSRKTPSCVACRKTHLYDWGESTCDILNNPKTLEDLHMTKQMNMAEMACYLNISLQSICNYFHKYNIPIMNFSKSKPEQEIYDYVKQILGEDAQILTNVRNIIAPYELDIFIPSHGLAIEFCGIYWHSERAGRNRQYHSKKYDLCVKQGIQLLTIFEDEWYLKQSIVQNSIKHKLSADKSKPIYARKCTIKPVSWEEKQLFLNTYHIQGNGRGSINYGLYHNNVLVAVIEFVNSAKGFLLNRYATSAKVVGGFSKLLTHFKKNHPWSVIYTFADKRWSDGKLYKLNNFKHAYDIPPDYYYVKTGKRYHKFNFRHSKIKNKFDNYNVLLSERQNCFNNGYHRIWDCGKMMFIMENKQ